MQTNSTVRWVFLALYWLMHISAVGGRTIREFRSSASEEAANKDIALTFDDGPHGTLTPILLDALKARNAHATFFVMGVKIDMEGHPEILHRMVQEGHEIGNHVWNHPVMSKLYAEQIHEQLHRTNDAIKQYTNYSPTIMRPPYGNTNRKTDNYISNVEGFDVILWSLDTIDWKRPKPEDIVKRVVDNIKPGEILLCHDIHPGTVEAIPKLVDALQAKGYNFLTVSEMIKKAKAAETGKKRHLRSRTDGYELHE